MPKFLRGKMRRKKASEIFNAVDPNLKVIDGGIHYHKHRLHHSTNEDWEKLSGVYCSNCDQEAMRLIDGLCPQCYNRITAEREEKLGREKEKNYLVRLFNKGLITRKQLREGRLGS